MRIPKGIWRIMNYISPKPVVPPYEHICQIGDPVLRMIPEKVKAEEVLNPDIKKVISNLIKVMRHYQAQGLSAPQIGVPLSIIAMEVSPKSMKNLKKEVILSRQMTEVPLTVFINPEMKILDYNKVTFVEGCESMRGFSGDVARFQSVQIAGLNEKGELFSETFKGWSARIAQHEMDHLRGIIYIDKMDFKSLKNDGWNRINYHAGAVELVYKDYR